MPNTKLRYILKDQKPTVLALTDTVQNACRCMCERRMGSVLVIDEHQQLRGIFTGRDAVRVLSEGCDPSKTLLNQVMTPDPVTLDRAAAPLMLRGRRATVASGMCPS